VLLPWAAAKEDDEQCFAEHQYISCGPGVGRGLQLNDGTVQNQTRSVENMSMLLASRAEGLEPGEQINGKRAHPATALITAMQVAGHQDNALGDLSL